MNTNQNFENTSDSIDGDDCPQTAKRATKGSQWWPSNEPCSNVRESLRTALSMSSNSSSPRVSNSLIVKLEFNLFLTICKPESICRLDGVFEHEEFEPFLQMDWPGNAGVCNILDREAEGPQLLFSFLEINHFLSAVDICGMATSSLWTPIAHVPDFFGEGLSSKSSKESTSWK